MDDSENNSKNDESFMENSLKFKTTLKTDASNPNMSSLKTLDLNIYSKGKRLSRQLAKLKKKHQTFLKIISIDSSIYKTKPEEKKEIILKSAIKTKTNIYNSNSTLPSIANDNMNTSKIKKVNFSVPKSMKKSKNKKQDKEKTLFSSIKFKKNNLNKLYGYNKQYFLFKDNLKKNKEENLEKYQDDILRLSSLNLCKDNLLKLYTDLRNLRLNSEETKPLPPINFQSLINHSLNQKKKVKKKGFIERNKKFKDMDEYEKEMYKIKTNSRHNKIYSNNNKFLYRMYEILPEHVVDTIYVKKKKF